MRVLALMMALVMVMPCFVGFGVAATVDDGLLTYEEVLEIGQMEAPAKKAYEEIMQAWTNDNGNVEYPLTYAGGYLNDDCKLAIKLVNGDRELLEQIVEIVEDDSVLVFENASLGFCDLYALRDNIYTECSNENVVSVGVSLPDNTVDVYIRYSGAKNVANTLSRTLTHPNVRIIENKVQSTASIEPSINRFTESAGLANMLTGSVVQMYPGQLITSTVNGRVWTGTIGWFGRYNFGNGAEYCMLTAGHVARQCVENDVDIYYGSSPFFDASDLGNRSRLRYVYANNPIGENLTSVGDYAFITFDGIAPINQVQIGPLEYRTITNSKVDTYQLVGSTVYKGMGVSGFRAATVIDTNATWEGTVSSSMIGTSYPIITGLISVDNNSMDFCVEGDSGGTVYCIDNYGEFEVCGIVSSKNEYLQYYTPLSTICRAGFIPYLG